jgi:hypothetical protein
VNSQLELLLSSVFPGALAPEHRADLEKSGLTTETIALQGIRAVPPAMIPKLLGFDIPAIRSALLFPFPAPGGGWMDLVRMKIFPPLTNKKGQTTKYLQPRGVPPRLYFCRTVLEAALRSQEPLWLVEGEKKALAVAQLGKATVGFSGVDAWHVRGSRALLDDFNEIGLEGRVVEVLPDGDFQENPHVRRAIFRLGEALAARGAKPRAVLLPRETR